MQNKIIILIPLLFIFVSFCAAKDTDSLLSEADKLKTAGKYEAAEKIYGEILKKDPENLQALRGKDDCRIMLTPLIPIQHLAPPFMDHEYLTLLKKRDQARTPWDKRRAELAIDRYCVSYTGNVFGEEMKRLEKESSSILEDAYSKIKKGESPEKTYVEAERQLIDLQDNADRAWKGNGPNILEPNLKKLKEYYRSQRLSIPDQPLNLSAIATPEVKNENEVAELTVSIKNRSTLPLILLDFQFEGLRYKTYSFQKAMYGSLSFDEKKNIYHYNPLAQQETYPFFNAGLIFPGETLTFRKKARVPNPASTCYVNYVFVDDQTCKHIYLPSQDIDIFSPADIKSLEPYGGSKTLVEDKNPFPVRDSIIYDDTEGRFRSQTFTLVLGEK